jgi:hypothetical protein
MWKYLNESVEGTSHRHSQSLCQDSSFVTPYKRVDGDEVLILACADGAGSATASEIGSALACKVAADAAISFLDTGTELSAITDDVVRGWLRSVHDALNAEANRIGETPRELASTLLLAIVGRSIAAFAQVGDGAIVIDDGTVLQHVFWPQNGEYQNTTFFITDANYEQNALVAVEPVKVREIALLSDGLQMLALNYSAKAVHAPFFAPMFAALREKERDDLIVPMRQFLDSAAVNARTDDDKTLILATRIEDSDAASL